MKKIFFLPLLFIILTTLSSAPKEATRADSYYHFLRGTHLRAEGQLEKAESEYLKAISGCNNPSYVFATLADLYLEMWKWEEGEAAAKKALSFNAENILAHEILGKIYMSQAFSGKTEEALKRDLIRQAKEEFIKVTHLEPDNVEAYNSLGRICLSLSQLGEAEQYYSRYTELNPFSDYGFLSLGELQLERGKFEEAQGNLSKGLNINSRNYRGYFLLGKAYESRELWDQSISLYEKALEYFPEDLFFLNKLGLNLYLLKKYEKALFVLGQVFQIDPSNYQALLTKAKILQANNQLEEAESIYLRLIESDQSSIETHLNYALFLENKGDYEGAVAEYITLIKKDVDPPGERIFFYNFRAGVLSERLKKFTQAEEYLRKAIELNPQSGEALNYLGYMLVEEEKKLDEALKFIEKALSLDPENGAYLDSLGWAYFKLKKYEQAETYLKKALFKLQEDPIINDHLGDLYFQIKEEEKAVFYWKKALEANIEYEEEVKRKIEKAIRK